MGENNLALLVSKLYVSGRKTELKHDDQPVIKPTYAHQVALASEISRQYASGVSYRM